MIGHMIEDLIGHMIEDLIIGRPGTTSPRSRRGRVESRRADADKQL
jgi:hypothetical protein